MDRDRIHITQHTSLGAAWFAGWLFSIGYLQLNFWTGALGLLVWPYFLGAHFVAVGWAATAAHAVGSSEPATTPETDRRVPAGARVALGIFAWSGIAAPLVYLFAVAAGGASITGYGQIGDPVSSLTEAGREGAEWIQLPSWSAICSSIWIAIIALALTMGRLAAGEAAT